MKRHLALTTALATALLSACAGGGAPPATYDLLAPRISTVTAPKPAKFQLVVNEPNTVRALESDRILVKPEPEQVTYYKGAVWSDRLPRLMQMRIIEAFQNAGLVQAVGGRADRLDADVELATEVRAFHIETSGGQAVAVTNLYVKMVDGRRGRIIASRAFEARTPTSAADPNKMVASLNQSFDTMLREIVPWVAANRPKTES
jgi:cholesterol transport system auxiliary component